MLLKKYSTASYVRQRFFGRTIIIHLPFLHYFLGEMVFVYLTSPGIKHSIACGPLTKQNSHDGQTQGKEVESHFVLLVCFSCGLAIQKALI